MQRIYIPNNKSLLVHITNEIFFTFHKSMKIFA